MPTKSEFLTPDYVVPSKSSGTHHRSQTPLFQQLYLTMSNWERVVANKPELQKIKKFRRIRKAFHKDDILQGDFSDMSSVDYSPKKNTTQMRRRNFTKSLSINSLLETGTSDDDDDDDGGNVKNSPLRRHSAPPITIKKKFITTLAGLKN